MQATVSDMLWQYNHLIKMRDRLSLMEEGVVSDTTMPNPPRTAKMRKQGQKKPPNSIPKKGIADFHSELLDGPYFAYFRRTTNAAPRIQAIFDNLHKSPQGPSLITTFAHLPWILHTLDLVKRGSKVVELDLERPPLPEKLDSCVQSAYIPWNRIPDFITGEEGRRSDVDTRFVCTKREWKEEGKAKAIRWNIYLLLIPQEECHRHLSQFRFLPVLCMMDIVRSIHQEMGVLLLPVSPCVARFGTPV